MSAENPSQAQAASEPQATAPATAQPSNAETIDNDTIALLEGRAPESSPETSPVAEPSVQPATEQAAVVEPKQEQTEETTAPEESPEPEAGEEPQTEEETPEEVQVSNRIRIDKLPDKALVNAATILAKAKGITFGEAWKRISADEEQPAPARTQPEPADAEPLSPEVSALETEVSGLEAQLEEAGNGEGLFNSEISKLTIQHSKAVARLEAMKLSSQQQAVSNQQFEANRQKVLAQTVKDYPALKNKESIHYRLATQLTNEARDPAHPDHGKLRDLDAPRYFAEEAAKLIDATPAVSPSVPPVKAAPAQPQVRTPAPAPGSKQTAPPPPQKTEAERVKESAENLEAVLMGCGAPVPRQNLNVLIR